jgi:flagellar hook protein FlgE
MLSRISAAEAHGGADALGKLESSECRLLLLDRKLPDLEASNLLLYQRAYQAAAEAINAVNQMLQTTIDMGASS